MSNVLKNGSIEITNKKIIDHFTSKRDFPFLISFDRTGSHWLRMVMELYFQKPSLVRIFYFSDANDFSCYHRHDRELKIERENIIYLYRHPVDTIYSNLKFYEENFEEKIKDWSELYGRHLSKWLLKEKFTKKKTTIRFEGMKQCMTEEFRKVCMHFSIPFDKNKIQKALQQVTKQEVQKKTTHDPRVMNLTDSYQKQKKEFKKKYGPRIMKYVYSVNPDLKKFFGTAT